MYEVDIESKKIKIVDYYELNGALEEKTVAKEDFFKKKSKEIDKLYDLLTDYGKEKNEENIKIKTVETIIKTQLKIDKIYDYLLNSNMEFGEYYKTIDSFDLKASKIRKDIEKGKIEKEGICFNPEEIKNIMANYNKLDSFYYMAFTVFFLEEFLLVQLTVFSDIYKASAFSLKEIKMLHTYFANIFSQDFSESFKIFEIELKNIVLS